jgi:predicted PolB exonuclease-like 3'-5' exonuclease
MGLNDENAERVVIDLETIAAPDAAEYLKLEEIEAPSNYRDQVKIAAYIAEKRRERIERAGLEADLNEIVAVGFMREGVGERPVVWTRQDDSERDLIETLWEAIGYRATVGFNTLGFDLPVLIRRSQLLGIAHPTLNLDRYRTSHIDISDKLSFNGKLTMRSLEFYARRFGIPNADTSSGADIARLVAEGNWGEVESHCYQDVEKTVALARRLGYLPKASAALVEMAL